MDLCVYKMVHCQMLYIPLSHTVFFFLCLKLSGLALKPFAGGYSQVNDSKPGLDESLYLVQPNEEEPSRSSISGDEQPEMLCLKAAELPVCAMLSSLWHDYLCCCDDLIWAFASFLCCRKSRVLDLVRTPMSMLARIVVRRLP